MESPVSDWGRLFDSLDFELPPTTAILEETPDTYQTQPSTEYPQESSIDENRTTAGIKSMVTSTK
jgi:hypothetical protein